MTSANGLRCLSCATLYELGPIADGCPLCREQGTPSNLTVEYDEEALSAQLLAVSPADRPPGMWRYQDLLPPDEKHIVTLGEGGTPMIEIGKLAQVLGVGRLLVKDESRNPTGSVKDRLSSAAVSMGRHLGSEIIVSGAAGNIGASVAAYCARADLACLVLTAGPVESAAKSAIQGYGGLLVGLSSAKDVRTLMADCVEKHGCFPVTNYVTPAIGTNPFGIEGYKTIAYEILERLDWRSPDFVVIPVALGSVLYGVWKGFQECLRFGWVDRLPVMVASETSGALEKALEQGTSDVAAPSSGPSLATALQGGASTFQAILALRQSQGYSVSVRDPAIIAMQRRLAEMEGLWAEPSAVTSLIAVERLRGNDILGRNSTVVCVLTGNGLRETPTSPKGFPDIPVIEPNLASMAFALRRVYGVKVEP